MSEREKQISYINTYIWNPERQYWWTYLQGSNGDADTEKRLVRTVGEEGEGGTNGESHVDARTPSRVARQPAGVCGTTQGTQTRGL